MQKVSKMADWSTLRAFYIFLRLALTCRLFGLSESDNYTRQDLHLHSTSSHLLLKTIMFFQRSKYTSVVLCCAVEQCALVTVPASVTRQLCAL
jgi:hypothetical protein